jgi:hypothetical protein
LFERPSQNESDAFAVAEAVDISLICPSSNLMSLRQQALVQVGVILMLI